MLTDPSGILSKWSLAHFKDYKIGICWFSLIKMNILQKNTLSEGAIVISHQMSDF
jgi:hypothetical protein